MKKTFLITLTLALAVLNSFAQSEMLDPGSIGHRLSAVNFINANTGFAAGDGGTILKTSDGGASWVSQPSGTTYDLYAASFPDENTYYAAGAAGIVIKTSDAGTTWQSFIPGSTAGISSIFFVNADTGFVTNGNEGTAVKTTDGGETWNQCLATGQVLYSVYFLDADIGYVSGINGIIMKTTDGGSTWNNLNSGTSEILFSVYCFDESSVYAVGLNGTIVHSSNGGSTWSAQDSGIPQRLMCVRFTDINTGYVVGDYGAILKTEDGGSSWSTLPSGTDIDLYAACFTGGDTGFACGGIYYSGIILKTTDGGLTWTDQSFVPGRIINVPAEYPTIQQGINAANNGDTVLVQQGTYLENINFNGKRIVVASLYLTTQDDAYIAQTIIDGNAAGAVVRFENSEDTSAVLCGFTLTNGHSETGGGIYCYNSSPELKKLIITNNSSDNGGGIYFGYYSFPHLQNVTVNENSADYNGGGIYFSFANPIFDSLNRCNIFLNSASAGSDLYFSGHQEFGIVKVVVDTFSVINPTYYYAYPPYYFSFDILNGKINQVEADLYVSPWGDDANNGLTESEPLKTIRHALQIIYADSLNPHTVYLSPGTYSPSTNGEIFPVNALDYITLSGESENNVIFDAEGLSGVININGSKNAKILNLTITGGYAGDGGGIYCYNSNPDLQHISLINNSSLYNGGAIMLYYASPDMQNVTIENNLSNYGGGISCYYSSYPHLQNVTIKNNSAANAGGGIYLSDSNPLFDSLNRCNIYFNDAPQGNDLYNNSYTIDVIVDTFTVLIPKSIHAYPLINFHFDILHGKLPQENITLFVSPGGDNSNTGLTPADPLKTIQFALSVINADSLDIFTIHLQNGTYSPSSNGEVFPVNIPEYVHLEGESESWVILDAEGLSGVIEINNSANVEISNLAVTGGNQLNGGGISITGANPLLKNITVSNNSATNGGGIYCSSSRPRLENVSVINNNAETRGGGIYFEYCTPMFNSINRCNIHSNAAPEANDLFSDDFVEVVVDTFTVLIPKSFHAFPLANFSFDILHGLVPQQNIDLFISPDGDNANSGLTSDEPLKTIQFALSVNNSNHSDFYTLHLFNGKYSPSANGEVFPLNIPDFLKVKGESENGVILDAEGLSGVIWISGSVNVEISGMTITGGNNYGGGIYCYNSSPDLQNLKITGNSGLSGGGIYLDYNTSPKLKNIIIKNNTSQYGGGIFCYSSSASLENVTIANNTAEYAGGGIYFYASSLVFDSVNRSNIYFNSAATGNDLFSADYETGVNIIVDTFSVLYPTGFHAYPLQNFNFDILNGKAVQVEADLYVSPNGDNDNSGLTDSSPLKTIYCAYSKMLVDSLHIHTIKLLAGTYGPSTNGEIFPLNMFDYVNLSGESESGVILDAEGLTTVISKNNAESTNISNLTITGGYTSGNGGGIYCGSSGLELQNVSITNNTGYNGGGFYCNSSDPVLQNVHIINNSATLGGGIYTSYANPSLDNVTIDGNSANSGGGLYSDYGSSPALHNVSITNNSAGNGGGIYSYHSTPVFDNINRCNIYMNSAMNGNDLYSESYQDIMAVVVDTFTVLNPTGFHAWPLNKFSFDILHGKIAQVDADLFISPDGDNNNTGLSAGDPLKNINRAYAKMRADSLHPHTVNLLAGTYSHSATGEIFPVHTYEYISISGESESVVILDAEGQSRVFEFMNQHNIGISNLTITGGLTNDNGGGIYSYYSSPALQQLTIKNNSAANGGGICFANSSIPVLKDVTISNNFATNAGGGIYCTYSSIVFDSINRCNIYLNQALNGKDLYSDRYLEVIVDTFSVLFPKPYYAMPYINFSFDILHGKIPQVNADMYVSPAGDDGNSGVDANHPLKTIQYATAIIAEDSQHPNTIRLLNGTYSTSTNGETFPLFIPEYISLAGESENGTVLDANGESRVFEFDDNHTTRLSDLTITGGFTTETGGGVYYKNSTLDLLNVTVKNNSSLKHGGGIYLDNSFGVMHNVTISDNAARLSGGGMYFSHSSPALQNVTISYDSAGYAGGGIYCAVSSNLVMDSVNISDNIAGNSGGGIYLSASDVMMENMVISGNSATSKGGGICSNGSDPGMKNVIISDNFAGNGGGIYCTTANSDLVNVILSNNSAASEGGGIYGGSSQLKLVNVSMVDNNAVDGGGIFCFNSSLEFINSILWNESAYEVFFRENYSPSSVALSYSDIRGGESGIMTSNNGTDTLLEGNINENPLFIGASDFPYALTPGSPCINNGTPDTTALLLPPNDLAGNPRIWNERVDMGAYEWNNVGIGEPAVVSRQSSVVSYPNPTRGIVDFRFSIFDFRWVSLIVYNAQGQEVAVVVDEDKPAGEHTIRWNANGMPAGIYYYTLRSGKQVESGKVIIMR